MTGTMTGSDEVEVRAVPTRRVSFEESLRTLTKHYAADEDLILSHMFASLSAVFPDGSMSIVGWFNTYPYRFAVTVDPGSCSNGSTVVNTAVLA